MIWLRAERALLKALSAQAALYLAVGFGPALMVLAMARDWSTRIAFVFLLVWLLAVIVFALVLDWLRARQKRRVAALLGPVHARR